MLSDHPVAAEFDLELNKPVTPDQVPYSSKDKYWWRCKDNPTHAWKSNVNNRTKVNRPTGCGLCRGNRIAQDRVPFERSLAGVYPTVAEELNTQLSGFTASEVLYGSKAMAWWYCPKGHEDYDMPINDRTNLTRPQGCPYCAGKRLSPERSLAFVAPGVAEEFLAEVNGIDADQIFSQSNKIFIWQCGTVSTHRWPASPNNRVGKGSGCPYCSGARVWDLNRLADLRPGLALQWDLDRNGDLSPRDVSVGSSVKVHWVCPKGPDHRWAARVFKRTNGQGCPACTGNQVSVTNSLLARRPDIAVQLDAKRSGISATELTVSLRQLERAGQVAGVAGFVGACAGRGRMSVA